MLPMLRRPFTLLEVGVSLAVVVVLLAVLVPALAAARVRSHRATCAANLGECSHAWHMYMEDHGGAFPYVPMQPGWNYAGVRFSSVTGQAFLDTHRPLSAYLVLRAEQGLDAAATRSALSIADVLRCPADTGITGESSGFGTGERTAFRSFGASYRANGRLLDARQAGLPDEHRGLRRSELLTVPSRLVLMGDPIWYEIRERTGRDAAWHGDADMGNLLFLDGRVKYMRILPAPNEGPAVFEPRLR
jgi:prepilin-type processing-associated H-X9-DG protein